MSKTAWSYLPEQTVSFSPSVQHVSPILLSPEEARDLVRYFEHQYLNAGTHPALKAVLDRMTRLVPRDEDR